MQKGFGTVKVADLVKAPWNYKKEDDRKQRKLVAGIRRHGQVETIIVRELKGGKLEVVNGNHRLDAFVELKMDTVHAFNLGPVSQARASEVAISTNELRFEKDDVKLAGLIRDIQADMGKDEDLEALLPFGKGELTALTDILGMEWDQFDGKVLVKEKGTRHTLEVTPAMLEEVHKLVKDKGEGGSERLALRAVVTITLPAKQFEAFCAKHGIDEHGTVDQEQLLAAVSGE